MVLVSNLRGAGGRLGHGVCSRMSSRAGRHLKATVLCVLTIRVLHKTHTIRKNVLAHPG
jgi:hypothetical protein